MVRKMIDFDYFGGKKKCDMIILKSNTPPVASCIRKQILSWQKLTFVNHDNSWANVDISVERWGFSVCTKAHWSNYRMTSLRRSVSGEGIDRNDGMEDAKVQTHFFIFPSSSSISVLVSHSSFIVALWGRDWIVDTKRGEREKREKKKTRSARNEIVIIMHFYVCLEQMGSSSWIGIKLSKKKVKMFWPYLSSWVVWDLSVLISWISF